MNRKERQAASEFDVSEVPKLKISGYTLSLVASIGDSVQAIMTSATEVI